MMSLRRTPSLEQNRSIALAKGPSLTHSANPLTRPAKRRQWSKIRFDSNSDWQACDRPHCCQQICHRLTVIV